MMFYIGKYNESRIPDGIVQLFAVKLVVTRREALCHAIISSADIQNALDTLCITNISQNYKCQGIRS